ncbi:indoleamine 2, 3-dioxyganeseb, partial [Moniliophthora roreri]
APVDSVSSLPPERRFSGPLLLALALFYTVIQQKSLPEIHKEHLPPCLTGPDLSRTHAVKLNAWPRFSLPTLIAYSSHNRKPRVKCLYSAMSSEPAEATEFWYGFMPTNPPTTRLPSEWESWEVVLEAATNEKLHLGKIESTRAPFYRCTSRPQTHPSSPPCSRLDPPFLRTYAHATIGFRTHEDPTAAQCSPPPDL